MAAISRMLTGFRLVDGGLINRLVDAVNNLTGNGTAGPVTATSVTGTTANFSGAVTFSGLPTTDPGVAGQLYSNDGVVTVSAG